MSNVGYLEQGTIKCPVCRKEKESLTIWRNLNGIPFYACALCIKTVLPLPADADFEKMVSALLRMGFRAGRDQTIEATEKFLSGMR